MDALARGEAPLGAGPADDQRLAGLEVHLDPRRGLVVEGDMAPLARLEVAADRRVEVAQRIEVERGGDAEGVVVRGLEHRPRLDQVDADQQAAAARRGAWIRRRKAKASSRVKLPMLEPG